MRPYLPWVALANQGDGAADASSQLRESRFLGEGGVDTQEEEGWLELLSQGEAVRDGR